MIIQPDMYTRTNFNTAVAASILLESLRRDGSIKYQDAICSLERFYKKVSDCTMEKSDFGVECECRIVFDYAINLLFLLGVVEQGKERHTYMYVGGGEND